jgi:hypothetical protein
MIYITKNLNKRCERKADDALKVLRYMESMGINPNKCTYGAIMNCYKNVKKPE